MGLCFFPHSHAQPLILVATHHHMHWHHNPTRWTGSKIPEPASRSVAHEGSAYYLKRITQAVDNHGSMRQLDCLQPTICVEHARLAMRWFFAVVFCQRFLGARCLWPSDKPRVPMSLGWLGWPTLRHAVFWHVPFTEIRTRSPHML